MKLCERAVNFIQVMNEDGAVRLCSWLRDGGVIGYLTKNSLEEIYHSDEARLIQEMHACGDHSNCNPNQCPYVANNTVETVSIDVDKIPQFPEALYLAYENVCNYHCAMCGIPGCMAKTDAKLLEDKYTKIDLELKKALPHVKHISANGLGELFVSRHTLKLLSEWEPLADPNEVSVTLETNGSLFDEAHWEQISNLGKYKLSVAITVLSFENEIYQELSGTKQSIDKLIDNLRYVKSLREKGVINYLELATVYQDKNYKQLPEFARRCIEEFGADNVRLRPFDPWGEAGMKEWLMDVRNVYHPHHEDFLEVMKDPILSHPKVHDWGGGKESGLGPEPYVKTRTMFSIMNEIFCDDLFLDRVKKYCAGSKIVIYGMTVVGKALASRLRNDYEVAYCLDRKMDGLNYAGIPIYGINHFTDLDRDVTVIIALHWSEDVIKAMLEKAGYRNNILKIRDLIGEV